MYFYSEINGEYINRGVCLISNFVNINYSFVFLFMLLMIVITTIGTKLSKRQNINVEIDLTHYLFLSYKICRNQERAYFYLTHFSARRK